MTIANDHEPQSKLLEAAIVALGFQPLVVRHAAEAARLAASVAAETYVLDVDMPIISEVEAARLTEALSAEEPMRMARTFANYNSPEQGTKAAGALDAAPWMIALEPSQRRKG